MFKFKLVQLFLISLIFLFNSHKHDEGMFPLSQLNKIDFQKAGFKISQEQIFNPNSIALTDALVRIGGCTGSFISSEGLIITNHHCVFGSVAEVSSKENDYLENGFYAKSREKELKIGTQCKITLNYEDVSSLILNGVLPTLPPAEKKKIIKTNIDNLLKTEREKTPDITIEISEMMAGYSYTLFRYQMLKDVRLVYVPPRDIGEFGGETDNWEWPKHTGDFSIVRAYIGKNGKPAEYSPENVPYQPKKFLKINSKGTKENDLVFILGYPGRTFRHQPAQFVKFQQDIQLPFISDWYGWQIKTMEKLGATDKDRYLKLAGEIKSLANVKKNYEGKMFGLEQTGLLNQKIEAQNSLKESLKKDNLSHDFIDRIEQIFEDKIKNGKRDMMLNRFNADCIPMAIALTVEKLKEKYPEKEFKKDKTKFAEELKNSIKRFYKADDIEVEKLTLIEMINRTQKLNVKSIESIKNPQKFVEKGFKRSLFDDGDKLMEMIDKNPKKIYFEKSNLSKLAKMIYPDLKEISIRNTNYDNELEQYIPLLLETKIKYQNTTFVPDANATLRLTYGYISSYRKDLNKHPNPFTHIQGILEKNKTDNIDYRISARTKALLETKNIAKELLDENGELIVCMLYNLDTTGGNSGSPVMDAEGNLVGVNFDRAYTATLNDFSWNKDYSRSIAVDIRYVLFVMKYLDNAEPLLNEIGVKL